MQPQNNASAPSTMAQGYHFLLQQQPQARGQTHCELIQQLQQRIHKKRDKLMALHALTQNEKDADKRECDQCSRVRARAWGAGCRGWDARRCAACFSRHAQHLAVLRHNSNGQAANNSTCPGAASTARPQPHATLSHSIATDVSASAGPRAARSARLPRKVMLPSSTSPAGPALVNGDKVSAQNPGSVEDDAPGCTPREVGAGEVGLEAAAYHEDKHVRSGRGHPGAGAVPPTSESAKPTKMHQAASTSTAPASGSASWPKHTLAAEANTGGEGIQPSAADAEADYEALVQELHRVEEQVVLASTSQQRQEALVAAGQLRQALADMERVRRWQRKALVRRHRTLQAASSKASLLAPSTRKGRPRPAPWQQARQVAPTSAEQHTVGGQGGGRSHRAGQPSADIHLEDKRLHATAARHLSRLWMPNSHHSTTMSQQPEGYCAAGEYTAGRLDYRSELAKLQGASVRQLKLTTQLRLDWQETLRLLRLAAANAADADSHCDD